MGVAAQYLNFKIPYIPVYLSTHKRFIHNNESFYVCFLKVA